jgi:hypothetical protein
MSIAAYETATEVTPISPVFPDTPCGRSDLVAYCRAHATVFGDQRGSNLQEWCDILFRDGTGIVHPERHIVKVAAPAAHVAS